MSHDNACPDPCLQTEVECAKKAEELNEEMNERLNEQTNTHANQNGGRPERMNVGNCASAELAFVFSFPIETHAQLWFALAVSTPCPPTQAASQRGNSNLLSTVQDQTPAHPLPSARTARGGTPLIEFYIHLNQRIHFKGPLLPFGE